MGATNFYDRIHEEARAEGRSEDRADGYYEGHARGFVKAMFELQLDEANKFLLFMGGRRFGPPGPSAMLAIGAMDEVRAVKALSDRLALVRSWGELLSLEGGPKPMAPREITP